MRGGYLEGLGGYSLNGGPFVRAELGYRPLPAVALYGTAEWNRLDPWAGVGLRWVF